MGREAPFRRIEASAEELSFDHDERDTGGMKWPTFVTLKAIHPEHGEVGRLTYNVPKRKKDKIIIDRMEVDGDHRRKGYGSALMNELQNRHPNTPIEHGDRTPDGKGWWAGYSKGKDVRDGRVGSRRTAAEGWKFEHHEVADAKDGGRHYRMFADPPGGGRSHMVNYHVTDVPSIKPEYGSRTTPDLHPIMERALQSQHPGVPMHGPEHDAPAEPEKPKRRVYYHGTTVGGVTHILPADHHGGGVVWPHDTDSSYAYASESLDHAWGYAEKAFDNASRPGGHPRVYQVRPIGGHQHVEEDPTWDHARGKSRNNNSTDRRSKRGWEVVREMKMPGHMGKPEDWQPGGDRW